VNRFLVILIILFISKADAQNASALRMGDSLFALGDYSKAIQWYNEAQNSEEKIARAYDAMGNGTKALEFYEQVVSGEEAGQLAQYNYGKLLLKSGRFTKADSLFRLIIKKSPKNPEYLYQLGIVKEKQKDSTAYANFLYAYVLDRNHQNALYKVAKYAAERREFDIARKHVENGLKTDASSTRFINLKAIIAFVNKDYHGAVVAYEQLVQLNQSNARLHENLAMSYRKTNRFEKAIKQYTILINEYNDQNPFWHFDIAKNFESLRYLEKAQRHYELAIILQDISLDDAYIALAGVYLKQQDYKNQMEALKKAVKENSESHEALYFLATAADNYFKDDASVIVYYERYLKKFGDNGKFSNFTKQRIKDMNTEMHFGNNKN